MDKAALGPVEHSGEDETIPTCDHPGAGSAYPVPMKPNTMTIDARRARNDIPNIFDVDFFTIRNLLLAFSWLSANS
jgi:hypothetical protein